MAKKKETNFKERIDPKLRKIPRSWWVKTQMLSLCGIPDYLGCISGRFCALELKKSEKDVGEKKNKLQAYILKKIKNAGGYAVFLYPENFKEVYEELQKFSKDTK